MIKRLPKRELQKLIKEKEPLTKQEQLARELMELKQQYNSKKIWEVIKFKAECPIEINRTTLVTPKFLLVLHGLLSNNHYSFKSSINLIRNDRSYPDFKRVLDWFAKTFGDEQTQAIWEEATLPQKKMKINNFIVIKSKPPLFNSIKPMIN